MKLDDLRKAALDDILAKMSPKEIAEHMRNFYEDILVGMVHTLCCRAKHGEDCQFYQEEEMVDSETLPSHLKWKAATYMMLEVTGVDLAIHVHLILAAMPTLLAWTKFPSEVVDFLTTLLERARKGEGDEKNTTELRLIGDVLLPNLGEGRGVCNPPDGERPERPDGDSG